MLQRFHILGICLIICLSAAGCEKSDKNRFSGIERPDPLDLIVPDINWSELTIEDIVTRMRQWGIIVCLEVIPELDRTRFTVTMRNAPVRQVLDKVASLPQGYQWEQCRSYAFPRSRIEVINLLPLDARERPDSVLNMPVAPMTFNGLDVATAMSQLAMAMPELHKRVIIRNPSHMGYTGPVEKRMDFATDLMVVGDSVTMRDVLNEITARSGGVAWVYVQSQRELQFLYQ